MCNTTKKLKTAIKQLAEKKVSSSRERIIFKKKASPEFRRTPEYSCWFSESDYDRVDLRYRIRHYLLAYALLRGRSYCSVEKKCLEQPDVSFIRNVLNDYRDFEVPEGMESLDDLITGIEQWLNERQVVLDDVA